MPDSARGPRSREDDETPLLGGRITPGVVRVGSTVRRPVGPHSSFVHELLLALEQVGFPAAPRFLGIDDRGREVLSFIEGFVPGNLDENLTDDQLAAAAGLLRRYHDASARTTLSDGEECVCHNDISPVNSVFVDNRPVALIDFDMASPGPRIRDVAYGAFLWLNLGWDGQSPQHQVRRLRLWCDEYRLVSRENLVEEIKQRVRETVQRRASDGDSDAARWWQHQLDWLRQHERSIAP
jgi:serine/threonine protein kinase